MTSLLDIGRIERRIEIEAPVDRVWQALVDAAELSAWFRVTIDGTIQAGRTITMTSTLPSHAGMTFDVDIVELTRPTRVVWRWHPGDPETNTDYSDEPKTTVVFTLTALGGRTRVEVSETGFDQISLARRAKAFADNSQGWTEVTVWLKDHVEASR